MLHLVKVQKHHRDLLWNINQKYLFEMTKYYPDDMDENGNYHYGNFEAYFTDPKRDAYFIYDDETLVGFAMVNPYSFMDRNPDHVMAEFGIFPSYRRKHFAIDAASMILDMYPGNWEIKFNNNNTGAKALWTSLTKPYHPNVYHISEDETVLEFSNN